MPVGSKTETILEEIAEVLEDAGIEVVMFHPG
jgi:multimeric flavodoxin WrbA